MSDELDARLAFLRAHGADDRSHSGEDLLHHLLGTRQILVDWGADPALADAGLFHSVYGTESFQHVTIPPSLRPRVRALIGADAEQIAWWFGVQERRAFLALDRPLQIVDRQSGAVTSITAAQRTQQIVLHLANILEQKPRLEAQGMTVPASYWDMFEDPDLPAGPRAALDGLRAG